MPTQTVLKVHSFRLGIEPDVVATRWQEDLCDLPFFRLFVQKARAQGTAVAIASFGRRDVIVEYLAHIFDADAAEGAPFAPTMIVTPSDLGLLDGHSLPGGKPKMLRLLMERVGLRDLSSVLFFDDDVCWPVHRPTPHAQPPGHHSRLVPPPSGAALLAPCDMARERAHAHGRVAWLVRL